MNNIGQSERVAMLSDKDGDLIPRHFEVGRPGNHTYCRRAIAVPPISPGLFEAQMVSSYDQRSRKLTKRTE